jgi:hypothetical protein
MIAPCDFESDASCGIIHRAGLTCNSCRPQLAQLRSDPDAQGLTRLGYVRVLHERLDRRGGRRRMPPRVRCTHISCSRSVGSVKLQRGRMRYYSMQPPYNMMQHTLRCPTSSVQGATVETSTVHDAVNPTWTMQRAAHNMQADGVEGAACGRHACARVSGPAAWSAALRCGWGRPGGSFRCGWGRPGGS